MNHLLLEVLLGMSYHESDKRDTESADDGALAKLYIEVGGRCGLNVRLWWAVACSGCTLQVWHDGWGRESRIYECHEGIYLIIIRSLASRVARFNWTNKSFQPS